MFNYLKDIQFSKKQSIKEVMEGFSKTAVYTQGTGFGIVVDERNRCIGVVTDGDIRKGLVKGLTIDDPVEMVAIKNFFYAKPDDSSHQILRIFDQDIRHIPVLDINGFVVNLLQFSDYNASARTVENVIRARSPVRISFSGGGTDMTYYFSNNVGCVLSSTINKYCYASVFVRTDRKIRLVSKDYNMQVDAESIEELEYGDSLDLIKACVRVMRPDFGFDLVTYSELDPGTGLGGSSAITAAVLGALNHFRKNNHLDRYHLADLAYQVERIELGEAGGWQDQYATIFGGINLIEFREKEVVVMPLRIPKDLFLELHFNLLLFRFGKTRKSSEIINAQQESYNIKRTTLFRQYGTLTRLTLEMRDALLKGELVNFGKLLDKGWNIKKSFTHKISNAIIDKMYDDAKRAGALGGKVLGAGESGYLLLYCDPSHQSDVVEVMSTMGARLETFDFVKNGLQTWTAKKCME